MAGFSEPQADYPLFFPAAAVCCLRPPIVGTVAVVQRATLLIESGKFVLEGVVFFLGARINIIERADDAGRRKIVVDLYSH